IKFLLKTFIPRLQILSFVHLSAFLPGVWLGCFSNIFVFRFHICEPCRDTMQERLSRAFGNNLNQLRLVKRRYDPYNFFRHNVNVLPATDESGDGVHLFKRMHEHEDVFIRETSATHR
ncbi:hypothetical protein PROFUN_17134, partial [Planoprotostelium fungivorum]